MSKKELSRRERAELEKLRQLPDDAIDTADIPEAPAANWVDARRGSLYRPLKQPVTIRIDADVLAWFRDKADGRGYQTEINKVLRSHVARQEKRRA